MTVIYVKTGDRTYDVQQDGQHIGVVQYYEGDRYWRSRVSRGRRHYRGNGWVWGVGSMVTSYGLTKDTRKQAAAALLKDWEASR